jgi:hypothetical protein
LADKPYPAWDVPHARWIVAREAQICVATQTPGTYKGEVQFRALVAGRMIVIGGGARQLASAPFEKDKFASLQFTTLLAERISCLVFRPEQPDAPDMATQHVFTRIAVKRQP